MKHKLLLPLVLLGCLIVLLGASASIWQWSHTARLEPANTKNFQASPLVVIDSAPVGLIGAVTALGANTVTIQGQPPGNATPVVLTVLVDAKTSLIKVGPASAYATSTATFAEFKKGMLLNVSATAVQNGVRHADRIVIPPAGQ